jgi:hypothetical protein
MPILQHYYTSFVNRETNSAGFQVKAMSSGISLELQSIIARLITYRIPSISYEQDLSTHPVALRYLYRQGQECILLCSQSNGSDENGRPGNFFAHTLVIEPDSFTSIPPIFYWRSSFWRKSDNSSYSLLESLRITEMEPALDIEKVWTFLASAQRQEQFFRLMCAVVHNKRMQRRIVIIDTADNVALWIATVSTMLPPGYRPLLSFATYHHDPYQSPFLITGTISDGFFRALPEEYTTYFILNADQDKVSEVEYSSYAEMVTRLARQDLYETQLLPIFSKYASRFPPSDTVDERLDEMVAYSRICSLPEDYTMLTLQDAQAMGHALEKLEELQPTSYTQNDLSELTCLVRVLLEAYKRRHDHLFIGLYVRAMLLLTQHDVQAAEESIPELLKLYTDSLLAGVAELGYRTLTIEDLRRLYKEDLLVDGISSPEYLKYLMRCLKTVNAYQLTCIWQQLGAYLMPSPHSRPFLIISLQVFMEAWESRREDGERLFRTMETAMISQGQGTHWLECAVESGKKIPKRALELFYCELVSPLMLDQRVVYRTIIQHVIPDIVIRELIYDIDCSTPNDKLQKLEDWVRHSKSMRLEPANLVQAYGLPKLEKQCSPQQWQELVANILVSDELALLLSADVKANYLERIFSGVSFSTFSHKMTALYKKYQNDPVLPEDARIVAAISPQLASGQLNTEQGDLLHKYLAKLTPEKYLVEIDVCMRNLVMVDITKEAFIRMISSLFVDEQRESFWKVYWDHLSEMIFSSKQMARVLSMLSYWFTVPTEQYGLDLWQHYVVQDFFLRLPFFLREMRMHNRYNEIAGVLDKKAMQYHWYPSLRHLINRQKSSVFSFVFPKLAQSSKKVETGQGVKQALAGEVTRLFENISTSQMLNEYHVKSIRALYNVYQRDQFWTCYWRELSKMLTQHKENKDTGHAERVLRLLAFWFDEAGQGLGQTSYVVQDFFLQLPRLILEVNKTQEFRKLLAERDKKVPLQPERYTWYPLVRRIVNQK